MEVHLLLSIHRLVSLQDDTSHRDKSPLNPIAPQNTKHIRKKLNRG